MTLQNAQQQIKVITQEFINALTKVSARDVGLDCAIGRIYVGDGCIVVNKSKQGTIEYYGGFQYIDKENVEHLGNYVVYSNHDRVDDVIERFEELDV